MPGFLPAAAIAVLAIAAVTAAADDGVALQGRVSGAPLRPDRRDTGGTPMKTYVPKALAQQHGGIRGRLSRAVEAGGRTGEAAGALARILLPHMDREDRLVFPALAILEGLARRTETPDPAVVLRRHEDLKTALPDLLRDHGFIVGALETLAAAARDEGKTAIADLSRDLIEHARLEEEILYPAAVLVGDYVRVTTVG
jgi:hypothetical protein